MKIYSYGLVLGITLSLLIFLTNVLIPSNSPDSAPLMLITASVIGLAVVGSAYHFSRGELKSALKAGALTSLLGFSISMLTFIIIDNVFLSIVSKQADKVWGFQHSSHSSMQAYINAGLLRGVLVGLPASIVFGIICGWVASSIIPKLRHSKRSGHHA